MTTDGETVKFIILIRPQLHRLADTSLRNIPPHKFGSTGSWHWACGEGKSYAKTTQRKNIQICKESLLLLKKKKYFFLNENLYKIEHEENIQIFKESLLLLKKYIYIFVF